MCRQILQDAPWDFHTDFMYVMDAQVQIDCEIRDSDITLAINM